MPVETTLVLPGYAYPRQPENNAVAALRRRVCAFCMKSLRTRRVFRLTEVSLEARICGPCAERVSSGGLLVELDPITLLLEEEEEAKRFEELPFPLPKELGRWLAGRSGTVEVFLHTPCDHQPDFWLVFRPWDRQAWIQWVERYPRAWIISGLNEPRRIESSEGLIEYAQGVMHYVATEDTHL